MTKSREQALNKEHHVQNGHSMKQRNEETDISKEVQKPVTKGVFLI